MTLRLHVIGDLHGQAPHVPASGYDAILAPGDFCSDAPKRWMFEAMKRRLAKPGSQIRWWDLLGRTRAREMVRQSLADGRVVLELLDERGVPVLAVPGNWDWTVGDLDTAFVGNGWAKLVKGLDNVIDVHFRTVALDGIDVVGYGVGSFPEYPQTVAALKGKSAAELRARKRLYETAKKNLVPLFSASARPVLFLSHNVPYGTKLDIAGAGPLKGEHVGSAVVRDMIRRFQPLLSVGAHVHENAGRCLLGRTVCVNTGFGPRAGVRVEIAKGKIKKLEFSAEK